MNKGKNPSKYFILIGAIILAVSFFLPWYRLWGTERSGLYLFRLGLGAEGDAGQVIIFGGIPIVSIIIILLTIFSDKPTYLQLVGFILTFILLLSIHGIIFSGRVPTLLIGYYLFDVSIILLLVSIISFKNSKKIN